MCSYFLFISQWSVISLCFDCLFAHWDRLIEAPLLPEIPTLTQSPVLRGSIIDVTYSLAHIFSFIAKTLFQYCIFTFYEILLSKLSFLIDIRN